MSVIRKKYCVNGEWLESKTDTYKAVTDSSTGEVIAEVPCCTQDEVESAIAAAHAAYPEWSRLSLSKRTQMLFFWTIWKSLRSCAPRSLGKIWMKPEATSKKPLNPQNWHVPFLLLSRGIQPCR